VGSGGYDRVPDLQRALGGDCGVVFVFVEGGGGVSRDSAGGGQVNREWTQMNANESERWKRGGAKWDMPAMVWDD
jgi:hypothetical protein